MKTIYTLLFFVLVLGLVACQAEDDTSMKNTATQYRRRILSG